MAGVKAVALETILIAHAPDAIIYADRAGVIRLWNHRAEALFGYRAVEAVGQTLDLIVPEPYRVAHWAGFSGAVQRGHFAKDDVLLTSRALTKDGRVITVELSAAIIWSPAGQVAGIMAIGRDITDRRAPKKPGSPSTRRIIPHPALRQLERRRLEASVVESATRPHRMREAHGRGDAGVIADEGRVAGVDQRGRHPRVGRERGAVVL